TSLRRCVWRPTTLRRTSRTAPVCSPPARPMRPPHSSTARWKLIRRTRARRKVCGRRAPAGTLTIPSGFELRFQLPRLALGLPRAAFVFVDDAVDVGCGGGALGRRNDRLDVRFLELLLVDRAR